MDKATKFHFVGIGGIGMSAIAQVLVKMGYAVTGSDIRATSITRQLENLGIQIHYGHSAANLDGSNCVVYSSSIDPDNPELKEARARRLAVKHRSQMLAALSADKWTAAVAGAHGKSTTTSLLGWVWQQCGLEPTVVVGAKVSQLGGNNFVMGAGKTMILEADESDASFLEYSPDAIIVTNIDNDHLDYFKDIDDIYSKFRQFLRRLKPGGKWYGCAENAYVKKLLSEEAAGAVSYGFDPACDYSAADVQPLGPEGSKFTLLRRGERLGEVKVSIFGRHNVLNATAVLAMALEQGLAFEGVARAVHSYKGAMRRFDIAIHSEELVLVDDYGHHPTEIRATLEAARGFAPHRRLVVVFQPHRYSRTKLLENDFTDCFEQADEVIITDVYSAGEAPIEGVSGEKLASRVAALRKGPTHYVPKDRLLSDLLGRIRFGDMVIMMGAGDIGEMVHEVKRNAALTAASGPKSLVKSLQEECPGRIKLREPLKSHTSIKIGGTAECWFEPENTESLRNAIRIAKEAGVPVHVLGGGSNLLISDDGLQGLVIHLSGAEFKKLDVKGGHIVAGAGVPLTAFIQFLISHNRGECEFLAGIPANIGGAVMMNAGSAKQWIGSYLLRMRAVDFDGRVKEYTRDMIPFAYRTSGLKDIIVAEAVFDFPKVAAEVTQKQLNEYAEYRRKSQDLKHASAGCMFRNPEGAGKSAGQLIEEAGLKGARIGQAQVSEIHANFVINLGGARHRDVLELIQLCEETVYTKFNVKLHREIKILA